MIVQVSKILTVHDVKAESSSSHDEGPFPISTDKPEKPTGLKPDIDVEALSESELSSSESLCGLFQSSIRLY
jgi:hypothetical protein